MIPSRPPRNRREPKSHHGPPTVEIQPQPAPGVPSAGTASSAGNAASTATVAGNAPEDIYAADDRCTVRWVYNWVGDDGAPGHVRGVDVFRVQDGKVAEKLAYVKG